MKATIFFLLSLLAFAKPGTQQDFRSEAIHKRAVGGAPADLSTQLPRLLSRATFNKYPFGQYGVLYLHPAGAGANLVYMNANVNTFMQNSRSKFPAKLGTKNYPSGDTNTNFAMAGFNNAMGLETGHSEYRLLKNLDAMLTYFMADQDGNCPSHIVIYTLQAPCYWKETIRSPKGGCTMEIVRRFNMAKRRCPAAQYVVGYRFVATGFEQSWLAAQAELQKVVGIIVTQTV